jgi:hypothetical protein
MLLSRTNVAADSGADLMAESKSCCSSVHDLIVTIGKRMLIRVAIPF